MTAGLVHIVDDDSAIRDALAWLFKSRGLDTKQYESAEAFLERGAADAEGVVLLDIRMDGMSGFELFHRLRAGGVCAPVIFLTGHGDVPMAVEALKQGAFDFIEKPFNDNELVDRVVSALDETHQRREAERERAALVARMDRLSAREREVMTLMLAGKPNKAIAGELGIAVRTVEVHRARILEKMGVRGAVELAALVTELRKPPGAGL